MVSAPPPPKTLSLQPDSSDVDDDWYAPASEESQHPFQRTTVVPSEPLVELAGRIAAEGEDASLEFPDEFSIEKLSPLPEFNANDSDPFIDSLNGSGPISNRITPVRAPDAEVLRNSTLPGPLDGELGGLETSRISIASGYSFTPASDELDTPRELGLSPDTTPTSNHRASSLELDYKLDPSTPGAGSALELVSRPRASHIQGSQGHDFHTPIANTVTVSEFPPQNYNYSATKGASSNLMLDMEDRYAVGDFTGALVVAEGILESNPAHLEAQRYAQSCRDVLTQMYAARLGELSQVVHIAIPPDQIRWLNLDHRAGFLLSLVDGYSSIEDILDISGMTRLDALRIMFTLVQQHVVSLETL